MDQFSRKLKAVLSFILSKQAIAGATIVFLTNLAVVAWNARQTAELEDRKAVQASVLKIVEDMENSSRGAKQAMAKLENLHLAHDTQASRDFIGEAQLKLSSLHKKFLADEQKAQELAAAKEAAAAVGSTELATAVRPQDSPGGQIDKENRVAEYLKTLQSLERQISAKEQVVNSLEQSQAARAESLAEALDLRARYLEENNKFAASMRSR